jgi:serine/threonine protein kinase
MKPLAVGDPRQIGPYQLCARLGAGGMGRVFLGFSPDGRAVAVKVIHPQFAGDPEFAHRFRQEARTARMVSGAYTAPVMDAGLDDERPWLATEYVPGPSLAEAVRDWGPLPEAAVWRLADGLVAALRAIHDCGMVHRDLKPANVLLTFDGPRVIDFGITRTLEGATVTVTGTVMGTPAFMPPEQAEGLHVGPAGDVFSLGSVLAFAATGSLPFGGGEPAAVLYRVVHARPDLSALPGQLRDLAAACLAKAPADRPSLTRLAEIIRAGSASDPGASPASFWPDRVAGFVSSCQDSLCAEAAELATTGSASAGAKETGPIDLRLDGDLAKRPLPGGQDRAPVPSGKRPPSGGPIAIARRGPVIASAAAIAVAGLTSAIIAVSAGSGGTVPQRTAGSPAASAPSAPSGSPAPEGSSTPVIASVRISGAPGSYILTVTGSGFGPSPGSTPFTGTAPNFRIADSAQIGHGEWGYDGDAHTLTYQAWSDQQVVVSGLGASPGDALVLALWNSATGQGVSWGGDVPPAPSPGPSVTSVSFSGPASNPEVVIRGNGFGQAPVAMPYVGPLPNFAFSDWRAYHAGLAPSGTWIGTVAERFQSWTDTTIVISGFVGLGNSPDTLGAGDPVSIQIWSPASGFDTGPQIAWAGRYEAG